MKLVILLTLLTLFQAGKNLRMTLWLSFSFRKNLTYNDYYKIFLYFLPLETILICFEEIALYGHHMIDNKRSWLKVIAYVSDPNNINFNFPLRKWVTLIDFRSIKSANRSKLLTVFTEWMSRWLDFKCNSS